MWIVPFTRSGHWFWLWIFPFNWLDALILTRIALPGLGALVLSTDFFLLLIGRQGMFIAPRHLILPSHFFRGTCCPALNFVFAFWTLITFYTLLRMETCQLIVITKFSFFHRMCIKIHLIQKHRESMRSSAKSLRQGQPKYSFFSPYKIAKFNHTLHKCSYTKYLMLIFKYFRWIYIMMWLMCISGKRFWYAPTISSFFNSNFLCPILKIYFFHEKYIMTI
jgi:hypothetical protein